MDPISASPVLKTNLTFTLNSDFPETLVKEDFDIRAISTTNSSYIRYLRAVEVDDAANTIKALFGGAVSGDFDMSIHHSKLGKIDISAF
mmetsp:Transcript_29163/g.43962  ORF Transcript_29163/g.43962 Transcript_29163/m.43962 type:complete len:89 (-) Transcript_29163:52-318(-)